MIYNVNTTYIDKDILPLYRSQYPYVDGENPPRLSGGKEGVGGRNCRPTAAARSAAFGKASGVDLRGITTGANEGTKRSEVGVENFTGQSQKSPIMTG